MALHTTDEKAKLFRHNFNFFQRESKKLFSLSHLTFYFLTYIHFSEMEMVSGEDPFLTDKENYGKGFSSLKLG